MRDDKDIDKIADGFIKENKEALKELASSNKTDKVTRAAKRTTDKYDKALNELED